MTIARQIAEKTQCLSAVSFGAGYGVIDRHGGRVLFPPGKLIEERRNEKGRCTFAEYEYADGSRLVFTYRELHGAKWEEKK